MINFRQYSEQTREEWGKFVNSNQAAWTDTSSHWIDFFEKKFNYKNYSFLVYKDQKLVGVMPLFLVKSLIFGKRLVSGPIWDRAGPFLNCDIKEVWPKIQSYLETIAKENNIDYIEIRNPPQPIPGYIERHEYVDFYYDLDKKSIEDIWKSIDKKLRNGIKKAQKNILIEKSDSKEALLEFYKLHLITMRNLGSPPFGSSVFEEFWKDIKNKNAFMLFAKHQGKTINAILIVISKNEATYEMNSYLPKYRDLQSNSLLLFEAIKICKKTGCRKFSFGRTLADSNVYHFKKRWNAVEFPLTFYYRLYNKKNLPSDIRYSKLIFLIKKMWNYTPLFISRTIGNYFRRIICM